MGGRCGAVLGIVKGRWCCSSSCKAALASTPWMIAPPTPTPARALQMPSRHCQMSPNRRAEDSCPGRCPARGKVRAPLAPAPAAPGQAGWGRRGPRGTWAHGETEAERRARVRSPRGLMQTLAPRGESPERGALLRRHPRAARSPEVGAPGGGAWAPRAAGRTWPRRRPQGAGYGSAVASGLESARFLPAPSPDSPRGMRPQATHPEGGRPCQRVGG